MSLHGGGGAVIMSLHGGGSAVVSHLEAQLEWLRSLSSAQLADATGAISSLSDELAAIASRISGEHEVRTAGWDRRLTTAKAEWNRALEQLQAECVVQLQEADELIALQREEASLLREEVALRSAQRDVAEERLAVATANQRRLVVRVRAAVRRAEAAEAEAAEAVVAADRASAEHRDGRLRAEAERGVLASALAIGEGSLAYLQIAQDGALPAAQREAAMLRHKLQSMHELARRHAADAAGSTHAIAEVQMRSARAERRCAALERRLQACEGELAARHQAEQQAAARTQATGAAPAAAVAETWSKADQEVAIILERCSAAEDMVAVRTAEADALHTELLALRGELSLSADGDAARDARFVGQLKKTAALEALLLASEREKAALQHEVRTRAAELAAEVARHRASEEAARASAKLRSAQSRAAHPSRGLAESAGGGSRSREPNWPPLSPPLPPASPQLGMIEAAHRTAILGGTDGGAPWGGAHHVPIPKCSYNPGGVMGSAAAAGGGTAASVNLSVDAGVHASGSALSGEPPNQYAGATSCCSDLASSAVTRCAPTSPPSSVGAEDGSAAGSVLGEVRAGRIGATRAAVVRGNSVLEDVSGRTLPGSSVGESSGSGDGGGGVAVSVLQSSLQATKQQLAEVQAEREALAESMRLAERERAALHRASEAEAAERLALSHRLEASEARLSAAEGRHAALEHMVDAQAVEAEVLTGRLRLAESQLTTAGEAHASLQAGRAAQAERHELSRRGEALLREQLLKTASQRDELHREAVASRAELATQSALVRHLSERLNAQAEMARLQIGLPPLPQTQHRRAYPLAQAANGRARGILRSGAAGVQWPSDDYSKPPLVQLRLGVHPEPVVKLLQCALQPSID